MTTLIGTIRESLRYKGREGQIAWMGHRLAGLGTLLFFVIHVVDTSWVFFAPELYSEAIALYKSPLFLLGEVGLMAAVIFHAINGLRIAVMDWRPQLWKYQRQISVATFAIIAILFVPAFIIMAGHIIEILSSGAGGVAGL
ncbi:MAG: succinate dehydrogenase, cytochrome b556 subunit [Chloroflexi bacterium]|nr:succinate dehydrogenase, cytochrome b556 subunit [Chloroflexota bacterium]